MKKKEKPRKEKKRKENKRKEKKKKKKALINCVSYAVHDTHRPLLWHTKLKCWQIIHSCSNV